ncbi:MAG: hypothetical protein PHU23_04775 [Dehalococcoidales bacterium]|nr:hypothetical protein [Dehalococcoidales bacterium]
MAFNPRCDKNKSPYFNIGYRVFGPALTIFTHKTALEAQKEGLDVLFFIARDGYVFKKIYDILRPYIFSGLCGMPPKSRYLCVSRRTVKGASLQNLTTSQFKDYLHGAQISSASLYMVLQEHGLEPAEFENIVKQHDLEMNTPIYGSEADERLSPLFSNPEFQDTVKDQTKAAKMKLKEYLVYAGFFGAGKVAYLDGQGEGSSPWNLEQTFKDDPDFPDVSAFYFNLYNHGNNIDSAHIRGIASDWRSDVNHEGALFLVFGTLIEILTHPNHGVTISYKKLKDGSGRIVPVFHRTPLETQYALRSDIIAGILTYARDYARHYDLHPMNCLDLWKKQIKDIKRWVAYPPKRDIFYLKNFIISNPNLKTANSFLVNGIKRGDYSRPKRLLTKIATSCWPQAELTTAVMPAMLCFFYNTLTTRQCYRLTSFLWKKLSGVRITLT